MPRKRLFLRALLALIGLTLFGISGFVVFGHMSLGDAFYMTVITLSTVGYHEVRPLDAGGRAFTIVFIVGGLGIFFYGVTALARELIEGEFQRVFGRRRVQRQIAHMKDHYIVCGFGRMGRIVCRELATKPVPFVVVERDGETLRHLEAEQIPCLEGDATEETSLIGAGIERARGLVAALSNDSDNVYVVLTARELNPHLLIVARAEDERSERKLLHAGATRVVSPYVIGGYRMAHAVLRPAVLDVLDLATHYSSLELQIEEITVAKGVFTDGCSLQESGIRDRHGLIVIAIKRPDGSMLFNPRADARIASGDRLVVMGETPSLRALEGRMRAE